MHRLPVAFVAILLAGQWIETGSLQGQDLERWLGPSHPKVASRDSWGMMKLVQPLSETVSDSVVQVLSGGRLVALGTVVSEDGFVLTKKSELTGDPVSVRLPSGEKVSARVAVVRPSNDLALIKLEDGNENPWGLKPAKFVNPEPETGSFVISSGRDGKTLGIGVLGVNSREVSHRGRLGVRFFDSPTAPVTIHRVAPLSGAEQAGLQGGDAILMIDDQELYSSQSAIHLLGTKYYPGDVVSLTVRRGEDTFETRARMSEQAILMESENDAAVNGPRNVRLSGFDAVIQHDTVLMPNQCGGPLLDSSGKVVGLNIARAGRVVSYALPSSLINAEIISMLSEARN
ncbi:MAG: PDZ domain-containing protein [Planctomycetota bacterium]